MANDEGFSYGNYKKALELQTENLRIQEKIRNISRAKNREDDDAMKRNRRMLEVMTKNISSAGGVLGTAMQMLQSVGGMGMTNMQDKRKLAEQGGQFHKDPEKRKQFAMLQQSGTVGIFEKLDKVFDKNFGSDSKWNKMFGGKGKMAAAGIGLGAAGAGIGLTSKIIDSSPLMQQMLKLLNFGIMLILRPIGDFFALLFRPILIFLLRKFIIPFYQTVYPFFLKNARLVETVAKLGVDVVKGTGEAVKTAVATSGKGMETILAKVFPKATAALASPSNIPKKNIPIPKIFKQAQNIPTNTVKPLVTNAQKVVSAALKVTKTINALSSAPFKLAEKAITKVTIPAIKAGVTATQAITNVLTAGASNKVGSAVKTAVKPATTVLANVGTTVAAKTATIMSSKVATKFIPIVGQALLAVDAAGSLMKQFAPKQYEDIRGGALGIGAMLGDDKGTYTEGVLDFLGFGKKSTAEQITGGVGWGLDMLTGNSRKEGEGAFGQGGGWFGMANGGMIREPIKGVGKSGQKYKFGERGSEAVIPMDRMRGGGSGVTVNVTVNGSIYSDRDMLQFQRTIMKAIETSSTRKAKL